MSDPHTTANGENLAFEAALDRLEALVAAMEAGELPLAELVAKYEQGSQLVRICEARLKAAEMKIEKLREGTVPAAFDPMSLPTTGE